MHQKTDEEWAWEAFVKTNEFLTESAIPKVYLDDVVKIAGALFGFGMEVGAELSRQEYRNAAKQQAERN